MKLIKPSYAAALLSERTGISRGDIERLFKLLPKYDASTLVPKPIIWNEVDVGYCPNCKDRDYLYSEHGLQNDYCGRCGQKLIWEAGE